MLGDIPSDVFSQQLLEFRICFMLLVAILRKFGSADSGHESLFDDRRYGARLYST